jgi:hypothetical protein
LKTGVLINAPVLAFPPNRHVNAKLRVFIDWIVELMPSMSRTSTNQLPS